jgi:hypothetical protein
MTFMRGQPKIATSGRRRGVPNKRTTLIRSGVKSAIQTCREGGADPIAIMINAARFLHQTAKLRTPQDLSELSKMPRAELEFIADLLVRAADVAAKVANFAHPKVAPVAYVADPRIAMPRNDRQVVVKLKIVDDQSASNQLGRTANS